MCSPVLPSDPDSLYSPDFQFPKVSPSVPLYHYRYLLMPFGYSGYISEKYNTAPDKKKKKASFTAPDAKVLVVDDVKMNINVFKALLKRTKISVDSAMSGPEALEMIKDNKYDIIFLDHMMPDMDGIETYKHMKELEESLNKDTTVIMLTANAIMGAKEEYLGIGFSDYLSKPVQAAKLEAMILKYLPEELVTKPDIS